MKIKKDRLNPLYDQYSNEENRLTHALLHTIGSSQWLFSRFLKEIVGVSELAPRESYEISTQKVPFSHGDTDAREIESIPDAWIVSESSNLGIAIEVKDKKNSLRLNQLRGHANRIAYYRRQYLLVITPDLREPSKIEELKHKERRELNIVWRSWVEVHNWLVRLAGKGVSGRPMAAFLISSMLHYLERRSEVLGFRGIKFPHGFNVLDAKTILNSMMEELEGTVEKHYKDLVKRCPAITTFFQDAVWDCFGSEEGLKQIPHLFLEFNQRHFIAQKKGFRDGYMEFDIDTLGPPFKRKGSKAKEFRVWWDAFANAVIDKKRINGQVMFKSRFYLAETKGIDRPEFIRTARKTMKAFKPLHDFLRKAS